MANPVSSSGITTSTETINGIVYTTEYLNGVRVTMAGANALPPPPLLDPLLTLVNTLATGSASAVQQQQATRYMLLMAVGRLDLL